MVDSSTDHLLETSLRSGFLYQNFRALLNLLRVPE